MKTILKQFFDKNTLYGLAGLLGLHVVAWVVQESVWSVVPFVAIVVAVAIITSRSLVWGLAIAMLEIFIGGHGHLIDVSVGGFAVGLRMGIFAAVMVGTLYHLVIQKTRPRFVPERDVPFLFLIGAVFLGSITGFTRNSIGAAFDDMNGYVTFAYILPIAMIVWTQQSKRILLWTFSLGATWVAGSTLGLWYLFTHLSAQGIWTVYDFVRDARLAEVTLLSGPEWLVNLLPGSPWYFRVFEQGQFTVMTFTLLVCAAVGFCRGHLQSGRALALLLALLFAVDIGGQSRSFWLGLLAGGGILALAVLRDRVTFKEVVKMKVLGIISILLALVTLWVLIVIPIPPRPDLSNSPSYRGKGDDTRGLAVSSRWNLLPPMMEAIGEDPLWGSGFGTEVTYISDDPRLRAINGTGEWTTYRFEWGYQDIWLKMGLPGLLAFMWYLVTILRAGYRSLTEREETRWIAVGLTCGIIALYAAHIFSPYLNHPIGLGFMIFVLPFFPWRTFSLKEEGVTERVVPAAIKPLPTATAIRKF